MERPIEASTTIPAAFTRACEVFLDDPGAVFRETYRIREPRARRLFRTELSVDLGAGASVHQEVTLQEGSPQFSQAGLVVPLTWQASGRERFLPAFKGELEISEMRLGTGLRVTGIYTVPLGVVGRFGNGLMGRRLARRSLSALVERIGGRLQLEVERRRDSLDRHREHVPVAAQAYEHPEIYIG